MELIVPAASVFLFHVCNGTVILCDVHCRAVGCVQVVALERFPVKAHVIKRTEYKLTGFREKLGALLNVGGRGNVEPVFEQIEQIETDDGILSEHTG